MTTTTHDELPYVVGNWKMNGKSADAKSQFELMLSGLAELKGRVQAAVCPPATLIEGLAERNDPALLTLGAQDCVAEACGARTGDLNAEMLSDAGASIVILGHSERRTLHGETDDVIQQKVAAAWRYGLTAVVCVGETLAERRAGRATEVVIRQMDASVPSLGDGAKLVIAYEPVWAIGSGLVPSATELTDIYSDLRAYLDKRFKTQAKIPLLYGGSVNSANTAELMTTTPFDGLLVGKASLKADEFLAIARNCAESRGMAGTTPA